MEGVPQVEISKSEIERGVNVIDFLSEKTSIFPSKGEARKMIQGGGVSINKEKVSNVELVISNKHFLNNRYILAQKGKKNYYLVKVV